MSKCSMQKKIETYGGADIDRQRFGKWAAADKERLGKWVDKWIDQYNDYAKLAKFKDTAERDSDIHGLPSIKFDQGGYVVAADPLGDKWKVKFGSNVVPVGRKNVASFLFTQIDGLTGNRHKSKESNLSKCSMQKKKESLAKKNEDVSLDTIRVSDNDVILVPEQVIVEHTAGRSFSVEIPTKENRYCLSEMKSILKGMCEDCTGYPTVYRDGSVIVIIVNVPAEDENGEWNGEYNEDYFARCRVELVGSGCDSIADYLQDEN